MAQGWASVTSGSQSLSVWDSSEQHPGIEVVDLDGGHSINVEAPERFDHAVLDFIDRHG